MAPFDGMKSRITCSATTIYENQVVAHVKNSTKNVGNNSPSSSSSAVVPYEIYDGGYSIAKDRGVCIRISNGTAGQIGFLRAWADNFIQHMVKEGEEPFQIAWYLGDSTESLSFLSAGHVDMALTYVPAAEAQLLESGIASSKTMVFRDRFALVGPHCNPAGLDEKDSIYTMFSKIVERGNADVRCPPDPDVRPATRFLSRCDKSATNIKESQIFLSIGQIPWGHDYSRWYHQYIRFPREALRTAAALSEYTLIDYGAWLSAPGSVQSNLRIFKLGRDAADDVLSIPAHLMYRGDTSATKSVPPDHEALCSAFYKWAADPEGGLQTTLSFSKNGHVLYSKPL